MKLLLNRDRAVTPSPENPRHGSATRRIEATMDDFQPSNEWHDAQIESVQIRPGTKKWAWELKITPSNGKMLRGVLKLVPAFQDPEEGARRRLAKKYPF